MRQSSSWLAKIVPVLLGLLLTIAAATDVQADNWHARLWKGFTCSNVGGCAKDCCPDNYCPKPMPCVQKPNCFQCDTYCPKPMPCVQQPNCFECDRYCRKPIPLLCCPNCASGVCGPGNWCKP